MGIIRNGIFGGFEKKTGPLVGRRIKGKNVISAIQQKKLKPRSPAQINQQLKFKLVISLLKCFSDLIAIGFKYADNKRTAFNEAFKYNYKRIITGNSPDYVIDYTRVVYSKGSLAGPNKPAIALGKYVLTVSWLPIAQAQFNQYTDKACFMIYCPSKTMTVKYIALAARSSLGCNLYLPPSLGNCELHVYMSFVSADSKIVSDSMYLGNFNFNLWER